MSLVLQYRFSLPPGLKREATFLSENCQTPPLKPREKVLKDLVRDGPLPLRMSKKERLLDSSLGNVKVKVMARAFGIGRKAELGASKGINKEARFPWPAGGSVNGT